MSPVLIVAILFAFASGVITLLVLEDIEVQKKQFRPYLKQIEKDGSIHTKTSWIRMKFTPFVASGWFFRFPSTEERPGLDFYPELLEIRSNVKKNWNILIWSVSALVASILVVVILSQ